MQGTTTLNRMSLPNRVGRYISSTTLLLEQVECRGVCQRVCKWELQHESSIFNGFPPENGSYECPWCVGSNTASNPGTSHLEYRGNPPSLILDHWFTLCPCADTLNWLFS